MAEDDLRSDDDTIEVSRAAWESLLGRVAELERSRPTSTPAQPTTPTADGRTDRRGLLKHGAVLAGAAAAGAAGLGLAAAQPAAAADGDDLVLGQANTATAPTTLAVELNASTLGLAVTDDTSQLATMQAALAGYASGSTWLSAVLGVSAGNEGAPGVAGYSTTGPGMSAVSEGMVGLRAESQGTAAYAVWAIGDNDGSYGLLAVGKGAAMALGDNTTAPPARTDAHRAGEIDRDAADVFWACVAGGTPGTWVRLAAPGSAGALTVLPASVRVYDSRAGQAPTGIGPKSPLTPGSARSVDVTANASGVPTGATAVFVNITAVPASPEGYLAAYQAGITYPGTSTLNWGQVGLPVANSAIVALASGQLDLLANAATDVVVDVIGYYQ